MALERLPIKTFLFLLFKNFLHEMVGESIIYYRFCFTLINIITVFQAYKFTLFYGASKLSVVIDAYKTGMDSNKAFYSDFMP